MLVVALTYKIDFNNELFVGFSNYIADSSKTFQQPENKMMNSFNVPNSLLPNREGPKRYTQMDTKSADYNNFNFGMRPEPPLYKRSNSADENMIGSQIYSSNSAFEVKHTSNNDHSHSGNLHNTYSYEEDNKFRKMLSSNTIDLDDFPVPPIPKEFKNTAQLFIPDKMEELIKKLTLEADELVLKGHYEHAKKLYLRITKMNAYDGLIWKSLGHIYLLQDKLMESYNCFQGCMFY